MVSWQGGGVRREDLPVCLTLSVGLRHWALITDTAHSTTGLLCPTCHVPASSRWVGVIYLDTLLLTPQWHYQPYQYWWQISEISTYDLSQNCSSPFFPTLWYFVSFGELVSKLRQRYLIWCWSGNPISLSWDAPTLFWRPWKIRLILLAGYKRGQGVVVILQTAALLQGCCRMINFIVRAADKERTERLTVSTGFVSWTQGAGRVWPLCFIVIYWWFGFANFHC